MSYGRKDFLSQPAPENYVAGLGRGATGFTTRSDLGPAREGPTPEQIQEALAKRAQQLGAPTPTAYNTSREKGGKGKEQEAEQEEDDERFQDPDNEVGLFAYGAYDREDDEADLIYQEVDEKMDRRRKARRLVLSHSLSLSREYDVLNTMSRFRGVVFAFCLSYIYCGQSADLILSMPTGKPVNKKNEKNTSETIRKFHSNSPI
jgi:hypothetical protein